MADAPTASNLADLLTKAVGDIAALLVGANKEDRIAARTALYVEAINALDEALGNPSPPVQAMALAISRHTFATINSKTDCGDWADMTDGDRDTYCRAAMAALEFAPARLSAQAIMDLPYQGVFNAIAAAARATHDDSGWVNISVSEFKKALIASVAPEDGPVHSWRHVGYVDDGVFHWQSGIAPRDCELFAKNQGEGS